MASTIRIQLSNNDLDSLISFIPTEHPLYFRLKESLLRADLREKLKYGNKNKWGQTKSGKRLDFSTLKDVDSKDGQPTQDIQSNKSIAYKSECSSEFPASEDFRKYLQRTINTMSEYDKAGFLLTKWRFRMPQVCLPDEDCVMLGLVLMSTSHESPSLVNLMCADYGYSRDDLGIVAESEQYKYAELADGDWNKYKELTGLK